MTIKCKEFLKNKEKATGITIHYVNEHYDEGEFIFQKSVNIEDCKTPEEIAQKVHDNFFSNLAHQLVPTYCLTCVNMVGNLYLGGVFYVVGKVSFSQFS